MRIVQAGNFPIDIEEIKGGVEASILGLTDELSKSHELIVVDYPRYSIHEDYIESVKSVKIFRFKSPFAGNSSGLLRIWKIFSIVTKSKPDICHLHSTGWMSFLLFVMLKCRGQQLILTIHGLAHIEKKNGWIRKKTIKSFIKVISHSFAEFMLINLSKTVIVDTDYVCDALHLYHKQHKVHRLPEIFVVPQGIHKSYFSINSNIGFRNLLAVGSINPRKGYIKLLESIQLLKKYTTDFQLNIAGVVSDYKYLEELNFTIKKLNLEQNVLIHTDLSFVKLLNLYTNASIFVLHTQEESQGIVFCEAMACGLPVVATNVGGVPYIIKQDIGGLLCEYGDIESFALNIFTMLNDNDLSQRFSDFNRIEALKYDWKNIADKVVSVYNENLV